MKELLEMCGMAFADGHARWHNVPNWEDMAPGQEWNIGGVRWRP